MILGSKYGQSAWYIRNTSTPDESLRPKSTMERLTFSLSGSALGMDLSEIPPTLIDWIQLVFDQSESNLKKSIKAKSINDRQGEEMTRPNLDPPKNVHSYDSFMKKHLSNYGYYGNISK